MVINASEFVLGSGEARKSELKHGKEGVNVLQASLVLNSRTLRYPFQEQVVVDAYDREVLGKLLECRDEAFPYIAARTVVVAEGCRGMHMEIPSSPQGATRVIHHLYWVLLASIQGCCASVFIYDCDANNTSMAFQTTRLSGCLTSLARFSSFS